MTPEHGTLSRYDHHGCRCEDCRQAASDYYRSRRVEQGLPVKTPAMPITDDERAELVALQEVARTVNGTTPEDDPRRVASVQLAALFHRLFRRGLSYDEIGKATGVSPSTVRNRLARHGHIPLPPSLRDRNQMYQGRRGVGRRKPVEQPGHKRCTKCDELKPLAEFRPVRREAPDVRVARCRSCVRKARGVEPDRECAERAPVALAEPTVDARVAELREYHGWLIEEYARVHRMLAASPP